MKNVLIIGGSYFAGRVFVQALSRFDQVKIHVFNRGHIPIGIDGVEQLLGDRDIPKDISENIPALDWHAIVDFCAYTPVHITSLIENIRGTIGHYIFISTTSIYAPTPNVPVLEEAPKVTGPQPELGEFAEYGYLKWLSECACERLCRQKDIPYTILRPSIIYGRYNYAPRESFFFDQVIADKPILIPENSNSFYSFVWVDDLAKILLICIKNDKTFGQAFNVASDEHISYSILVDKIEEVLGRPIKRRLVRMDDIITERIPLPFPPDDHLLYDGRKLKNILNFVYTPFIKGIGKTWQYYEAFVSHGNNI